MSGTLSFAAGQVFIGSSNTTGATGEIALTQVGSVDFDTTITPPTISDITITQDVAASETSSPFSLSGLGIVDVTLESATIESVDTAATVTLTTADIPPGITIPPGFTLPQTEHGTTLHVSVQVSAGLLGDVALTGDVGVYGINGTLALVGVQDLVADGATFNVGAAVLSLGPQQTGAVNESFAPDFTPTCFAAGTRLATPDGERTVETLASGMCLRLAGGGSAPVVWVGHRRIDCARHPRPADVWPVRIAAHAFGLDRPRRELFLSPDHAVFVDDVLIPIRYLLNGATVVQEPTAEITYWHVELPRHVVLLADGLPAESYLDTGNRTAFANGGGVVLLHADFARSVWRSAACAELVTAGPARERVYRRLIAQALSLGWTMQDAGGGAVRWIAPDRAALARTA